MPRRSPGPEPETRVTYTPCGKGLTVLGGLDRKTTCHGVVVTDQKGGRRVAVAVDSEGWHDLPTSTLHRRCGVVECADCPVE